MVDYQPRFPRDRQATAGHDMDGTGSGGPEKTQKVMLMPSATVTDDRRVLVVDDESSLRKVLADLLRLRGYDPVAVGSGEEALELVKTQAFAVAIIDIALKDGGGAIDGIELMRQLKAVHPHTECVILTGLPSQKTAIEAVGAGASGYLLKPFNITELLGTLERALARRRENAELVSAQRRAQQLTTDNLRMLGRLRGECATSLHNLIKLGQNIIESPNLKDAQAFGRLVQTETQCVLDVVEELLHEAEGRPVKH